MNLFFVCLKKEIKLFFSKSSLVIFVILPILLLSVMTFTLGDASSQNTLIKPFKIAVRNYDDDVIATGVIGEMAKIEIFQSIDVIEDSLTDEQAFANGYATIVTFPEGFFRSLYNLNNMQIQMVSNSDMPLESGIVDSIFSNMISIFTSEQEVWKAEIAVRYGEDLSEKQVRKLWKQNIEEELGRLFGRNRVFSSIESVEGYALDQSEHIVTSLVSILSMFVPLAMLSSIRQEMSMGIFARSNKRKRLHVCMLVSKALIGLVVLLVISLASALVFGISITMQMILGISLSYLASFAIFALAYYLCRSSARVQVMGALFILFSLVVSGVFYPYSMFPSWAQTLAEYTIPYNLISAYSAVPSSFGILAGMALAALVALGVIIAVREEE